MKVTQYSCMQRESQNVDTTLLPCLLVLIYLEINYYRQRHDDDVKIRKLLRFLFCSIFRILEEIVFTVISYRISRNGQQQKKNKTKKKGIRARRNNLRTNLKCFFLKISRVSFPPSEDLYKHRSSKLLRSCYSNITVVLFSKIY